MIKHEYMETKSPETVKPISNIAVGGGMHYDAKRIELEKNTMKMLNEKRESDIHSRDVVHFDTTTDMIAFRQKNNSYFSENTDYQNTKTAVKTDVEKNIDEAERYINFIATQKSVRAISDSEQKQQKPLPSTTELSVFEPKISFDETSQSGTAVYIPKAGTGMNIADNAETRAFRRESASDELTKAFRIGSVTEQARAFSSGGGITGQASAFETRAAITEQTRAFPAAGTLTEQTKAYLAAGVITEQTRAYPVGSMMTEQSKAFTSNREAKQTRMFDAYSGQMSEFQNTSDITPLSSKERKTAKKKRNAKESPVRFEYTSPMQNEKIAGEMESRYKGAKVRLVISVFFAVMLFLIENIAPVKPLFPTPFAYIIADWVLAFACMLLVLGRVKEAVRSFFRWKPGVDCITIFAFFFSVAATTAAIIFEKTESVITLYNFPFAVCVVLDLLFVYYRCRRDIYSFSVLASSHDKSALVLGDSEEETLSEAEYFMHSGKSESIRFGEVKSVNFVDGYFAHASETPSIQAPLKIFIPVCLAVSVAFFFCALCVMKCTVAESIGISYATFMMCMPFSAFLAYCYPLYLAARRAHSYHSAILCDKTPDEYRNSSMVVFRDTEAIPAGKAKVKSIRLYGDKKIDNAIYYASSIYSVIGGPLEDVFRSAALNSVSSENVQIREISAEGVCAMVDGKNIVIGRPAYMEEQCFETMPEPGDDEYDGKTNKRIFYLACDQFIIAKFYIQYSVSTDFLYIANRLLSAGLGISVRTADPCLDDGIFYENKIDPEQNAIRISRACLQGEEQESVPANRAGIVSVGDVKELIKSYLVCKKLESVKRTNLVLHVIASVFAIAVMALVIFTGNAVGMYSVFPALYQLFWILPTYFVSKVYL